MHLFAVGVALNERTVPLLRSQQSVAMDSGQGLSLLWKFGYHLSGRWAAPDLVWCRGMWSCNQSCRPAAAACAWKCVDAAGNPHVVRWWRGKLDMLA